MEESRFAGGSLQSGNVLAAPWGHCMSGNRSCRDHLVNRFPVALGGGSEGRIISAGGSANLSGERGVMSKGRLSMSLGG